MLKKRELGIGEASRGNHHRAFGLMCLISYAFFVSGERSSSNILARMATRMMGLILAVIGMQMLVEAIHGAVQAYK